LDQQLDALIPVRNEPSDPVPRVSTQELSATALEGKGLPARVPQLAGGESLVAVVRRKPFPLLLSSADAAAAVQIARETAADPSGESADDIDAAVASLRAELEALEHRRAEVRADAFRRSLQHVHYQHAKGEVLNKPSKSPKSNAPEHERMSGGDGHAGGDAEADAIVPPAGGCEWCAEHASPSWHEFKKQVLCHECYSAVN
jgi:hypothetical protein